MNYLEQLIWQYYDWKKCIVKTNIKVGKRPRGGWDGELDVVIYDPENKKIIHYEPSTDVSSWETRYKKYRRKFILGRKYIRKDVFPWLPKNLPIEQRAVFFNAKMALFSTAK